MLISVYLSPLLFYLILPGMADVQIQRPAFPAPKWIFEETFEGPRPLATVHKKEFGAPHAFTLVDTPVFQGRRAARLELRDTDPMVSNGTRAEVTIVKDAVEKEMWYSFAVLFPSEGFEKDRQTEIISQWWQSGDKHLGEANTSPATALRIKSDRFILDTGFNGGLVSRGVEPESRRKIDLGPVTKEVWHQFVFHFVHSYQSEGLIEVWHNGNKILSHAGGNMYNNVALPKWKLGIYKWKWNEEDTTDTHRRVLYYDNIRVGNKSTSLTAISTGTGR